MSSYQKFRKKGRKKKAQPAPLPNRGACDFHHFLFQKRHWNQGYAKLIRNHPYAGAKIPMATLHREIHSKVHDVPRPNGDICKQTYQKLVQMCKSGELDPCNDSPVMKLQFFIDEWAETCPATAEILRWQQQIIRKYYKRRGGAKMINEPRWTFKADLLYDDEESRNETYDNLISNGVSAYQIEGSGKRLKLSVPNVNVMMWMRISEIVTRFHTSESNLSLTKAE
jgi:hypothetical protein